MIACSFYFPFHCAIKKISLRLFAINLRVSFLLIAFFFSPLKGVVIFALSGSRLVIVASWGDPLIASGYSRSLQEQYIHPFAGFFLTTELVPKVDEHPRVLWIVHSSFVMNAIQTRACVLLFCKYDKHQVNIAYLWWRLLVPFNGSQNNAKQY